MPSIPAESVDGALRGNPYFYSSPQEIRSPMMEQRPGRLNQGFNDHLAHVCTCGLKIIDGTVTNTALDWIVQEIIAKSRMKRSRATKEPAHDCRSNHGQMDLSKFDFGFSMHSMQDPFVYNLDYTAPYRDFGVFLRSRL